MPSRASFTSQRHIYGPKGVRSADALYAGTPQSLGSPLDAAMAQQRIRQAVGGPGKPAAVSPDAAMSHQYWPPHVCITDCVNSGINSGACAQMCPRNMPSPSVPYGGAYQPFSSVAMPNKNQGMSRAPTPASGYDKRVCAEAVMAQCEGDWPCMTRSLWACGKTYTEPGDIRGPHGPPDLPKAYVYYAARQGAGIKRWPYFPKVDRPPTISVRGPRR